MNYTVINTHRKITLLNDKVSTTHRRIALLSDIVSNMRRKTAPAHATGKRERTRLS